MEEKTENQINPEWFKQLTHCGVSLKSFKFFSEPPEMAAEELILLNKYCSILEALINDTSEERIEKALEKLEAFSLRTFAGYIQSVKLHSSYGQSLYQKEWTLCYILLGQLKLIKLKFPDVTNLIMKLSFDDMELLNEHKFFIFPKPAEIRKASDTLKIDYDSHTENESSLRRAKQKTREIIVSQKKHNDNLRAHKLGREIIALFNESDEKEEYRKRGLTITGPLDDLMLFKMVYKSVQNETKCTLILKEKNGTYKEVLEYSPTWNSSGSSRKIDTTRLKMDDSKKRAQALFERIIKEFTELKNKSKIMKNGLVIEARPDDYPHIEAIKEELSQIIKCKVFVRVKEYEKKSHAGDTLVSIKF